MIRNGSERFMEEMVGRCRRSKKTNSTFVGFGVVVQNTCCFLFHFEGHFFKIILGICILCIHEPTHVYI